MVQGLGVAGLLKRTRKQQKKQKDITAREKIKNRGCCQAQTKKLGV